jgi:hypothetical protein
MRANRNTSRVVVLALLALAALAGCGKNPASPSYEAKTALFGYLYVGEAVSADNALLLTRTMPVDQYYDPAAAAVRNAVVLLQAQDAPAPDTLRMVAPGRYANAAVVIAPHTTYHLTVHAGTETITATTTTPSAFTAGRGPNELPAVMKYSTVADSFPVIVSGPGSDEIMYVDAYCLEYWRDATSVFDFGGDAHPNDYAAYGGDNAEPRHITSYFHLGDLDPAPGGGYRLGLYNDLMAFYGEYRIGVFTIDENYYQYLYREHPEVHGGVVGGIGVFGSACRRRYHIKTVP